MVFSTDIFELQHKSKPFKLIGATIPSPQDVFFRSKQEEIFQQYESARIFLRETETDDWNHWFVTDNPEYQDVFQLLFKERMFEAALMFYNIIVDISWVLCYVSAEYAQYGKDESINFTSVMSIEDAYDLLRKAENSVTSPNSEDNPLGYLKIMCPEFIDSIDLVIDFWKRFSNHTIRGLYNFIKHKGKPLYSEIEIFKGPRFMGLIIGGKNCPSDIRDVQKVISLSDSIQELKEFDDNMLYPYVKELFASLERTLKPSPFI